MGCGASSESSAQVHSAEPAPRTALASWTSAETGSFIRSLGPAYAPYARSFSDAGVDGTYLVRLLHLDPVTADAKLHSHLGVASPLHREMLLLKLHDAQQAAPEGKLPLIAFAPPSAPAQAMSGPPGAAGGGGATDDRPHPAAPTAEPAVDEHAAEVSRRQAAAAAAAKTQAAHTAAVAAKVQEALQQGKQVKVALKQVAAQGEVAAAEQKQLAVRVDALAVLASSAAAGRILPARLTNLPRLCAHFTPRASLMAELGSAFAEAFAAGVSAPLVALVGIAGSGKSELAKRFALEHFNRPDSSGASSSDPAAAAALDRRLCWFLNAESPDALLRSFKLLCAALKIEWRAESGETKEDTFARISHDAWEQLRRFYGGAGERDECTLLFDNATSYSTLEPYIPRLAAGAPVRIVITSLNGAVLHPSPAEGRYVVSLNGGLRESEALALLASTSGIRVGGTDGAKQQSDAGVVPAAADALAEQRALIQQLDSLPLAISTAGLYIAHQRMPKRGRGAASPAAALYGAREYLVDLRAHSTHLLRSDQTLRGQSDYKRGQAGALQLAIQKTPTHIRQLLDYCTVLNSQELPYDLLAHLFARSVADRTGHQEDPPPPDESFDAMLDSPSLFSLLCVDQHNRLYMHRSTQLQLVLMAEAEHGGGGGGGGSGGAGSAVLTPTDDLHSGAGPNPSAESLRAAPNDLQRWKAALVCEIVESIGSCWPAREEDTLSLLSLEPVLPTLLRLAEECAELPLLHSSLAPLRAALFAQVQLGFFCLQELHRYDDMQQLAGKMMLLSDPGSEEAQWARCWECDALKWTGDESLAERRLYALLRELEEHVSMEERQELRIRVGLRVATLRRLGTPTAALQLIERIMGWLADWLGDEGGGEGEGAGGGREHILLVQAWCTKGGILLRLGDKPAAHQAYQSALGIAERTCGPESTQAALTMNGLANSSCSASSSSSTSSSSPSTPPEPRGVAHYYFRALSVFDRVFGPASVMSVDHARILARELVRSEGAEAAGRFLRERRRLLEAELGTHERVASFLASYGQLLWEQSAHDTWAAEEAVQLEQASFDMFSALHGPEHIHSLAVMARLAQRKHQLSLRAGTDADHRSLLAAESLSLRSQLLSSLPRLTGGPPQLLLAELIQIASYFAEMDPAGALQLGQHALHLAREKFGEEHELVAQQSRWLARLHAHRKEWGEAIRHFKWALRLFARQEKLMHASVTAGDLADVLGERMMQLNSSDEDEDEDKVDEMKEQMAEEELAARFEAIKLAVAASGERSAIAATQHGKLASTFLRRSQHAQALQSALQALRIRQCIPEVDEEASGAMHVLHAEVRLALASLTDETQLREVLQVVASASSSDPWAGAFASINLARALILAQRTTLAHQLLTEATPILEQGQQPLFLARMAAAELHAQMGQVEEELGARLLVLESLRQEEGAGAGGGGRRLADVAMAHLHLAISHCRLHRYAEALRHFEEVAHHTAATASTSVAIGAGAGAGVGAESEQSKNVGHLLAWCRMQASFPTPHQSCLLRFEHPLRLSKTEFIPGVHASVLLGVELGGDSGSNAPTTDVSPYRLRSPISDDSASHVLYFEVTVGEVGEAAGATSASAGAAAVCLGFSAASHSVGKLPGDAATSIGLRCCAGALSLLQHPRGGGGGDIQPQAPYAPPITAGDTVGAGLDRRKGVVYFTHNGRRFKDVDVRNQVAELIYACVGFPGDVEHCAPITLNFGEAPFKWKPQPAELMPSAAIAVPDASPCVYSQSHSTCSWLVSFDSPLSLRRTLPFCPGPAGVVVLADPGYKMRPLSPSTSHILYCELTIRVPAAQLEVGGGPIDAFVGFVGPEHPVDIPPGLRPGSVGWHGDAGGLFQGSGADGRMYGPAWSAGSTIGVVMDTRAKRLFFRFNGGLALKPISVDVASMPFLCVGFGPRVGAGVRMDLNFGDTPFRHASAAAADMSASLALPSPHRHPFVHFNPHCSWLVTFDSPFVLRRTIPFPNAAGSVLLKHRSYALRPLRRLVAAAASPESEKPPLLYFECTILRRRGESGSDAGPDGAGAAGGTGAGGVHASIGLATADHAVFLPGLKEGSIGFHGSNGGLFPGGPNGVPYGPLWSPGDVVGCGLDVAARLLFFTHQGRRLPDVPVPPELQLACACVGFGPEASTEQVQLNMGERPFRYQGQ